MSTDLSALGIKITPEGIVKTTQELTAFAKAANAANAAAGKRVNIKVGNAGMAKAIADMERLNAAVRGMGGGGASDARLVQSKQRVADQSRRTSAALETEAQKHDRLAAVVERAAQRQIAASNRVRNSGAGAMAGDRGLAAAQTGVMRGTPSIAGVRALKDNVDGVAKSFRFTAHEGLNFSRQMADIGVTAAMGMNPLMIAIQQGPQLFDIFQQSAVRSSMTIRQTFMATGAIIWTALAPLLPIIAAVAAAVGTVALAMRAMVKEANSESGLKKFTTEMGYTKAEVKQLNAVTVTYGDVAKATFQLVGEAIWGSIGPAITSVWDTMRGWIEWIGSSVKSVVNFMIGGFLGALATIKKAWVTLPAAIADAATMAANALIKKVDEMVNGAIESLNGLIGNLPFGIGEGMLIEWRANSGQLKNEFAGTMAEVSKIAQDEIKKAQGVDYLGNAAGAIIGRARDLARQRQEAMAAEMLGTPSGGRGGRGGRGDASRLADILSDAEADIKAEKARAAAVGLSAHAVAELEQRTRILSQLEREKIPITDKLRDEVDRLAKAYADASTEVDRLRAVQGVLDDAVRQSDAINDELATVGLYGDELIRARRELEMLRAASNALPRGEELSPEDASRIRDAASEVSGDEINLKRSQFLADMARSADDAAIADRRLREELGLSGQALAIYRMETDLLNQARQQGIALTPDVLASINATATAIGGAEYATQKLIERQQRAAQFFTDMFIGIADGSKSAKQAVGELILELARMEMMKSFSSLFSKGIGLLGGALGGGGGNLFSGPTDFSSLSRDIDMSLPSLSLNAKGGTYSGPGISAYSNSVVSKPTLFPFAKGIGLMGEAGEEAIMPLSRGPDGVLGVKARGAGNDNGRLQVSVSVDDSGNLRAMVRDEAGAVVAESAPTIVGRSVQASQKSMSKSKQGWKI